VAARSVGVESRVWPPSGPQVSSSSGVSSLEGSRLPATPASPCSATGATARPSHSHRPSQSHRPRHSHRPTHSHWHRRRHIHRRRHWGQGCSVTPGVRWARSAGVLLHAAGPLPPPGRSPLPLSLSLSRGSRASLPGRGAGGAPAARAPGLLLGRVPLLLRRRLLPRGTPEGRPSPRSQGPQDAQFLLPPTPTGTPTAAQGGQGGPGQELRDGHQHSGTSRTGLTAVGGWGHGGGGGFRLRCVQTEGQGHARHWTLGEQPLPLLLPLHSQWHSRRHTRSHRCWHSCWHRHCDCRWQ